MRNPDRLDDFYTTIHDYHKTYFPDWRFGQLIVNFCIWCKNEEGIDDIFFLEEDRFITLFEKFIYSCIG